MHAESSKSEYCQSHVLALACSEHDAHFQSELVVSLPTRAAAVEAAGEVVILTVVVVATVVVVVVVFFEVVDALVVVEDRVEEGTAEEARV